MDKHLRKRKVKLRFKEDIEPQEVFLDSLAQKKEAELEVSEKKFEVPISKKILQGFYIAFLILMFIFFGKTFQFQILEGEGFSSLAKANKTRVELIQAERGVIYDRFNNQLIWNLPTFDLVLDKRDLPWQEAEREKIFREVSKIIKRDFEQLKKEVEESDFPKVLISENISQETLILLETKIKELPGCQIEINTVRDYIEGPTFSHLIGHTGKINKEELKIFSDYSIIDYIGKTGLEKSYESILRGNPGKLQIERDASGNLKSKEIISDPEPGKSLVLWLDSELQQKIEERLEVSLQRVGAKKGAVVAMNPKTGGIISLVSWPSFDNNLFSKGGDIEVIKEVLDDPLEPLFNLAIAGGYPTGSTIKPLIASAALEENLISPQKKINCQGKIEVEHEYQPEIIYTYRDWKTHGWTDIRKAIAESCNIYFYRVGGGHKEFKGLGVERIKKYLSLFGWGKVTGIDLPSEAKGLVPDPSWKKEVVGESWYIGNTYHLSIGQGYLRVTPLQVATSFSAIANGGKLFQPRVVQKTIDNQTGAIEEIKPEIIQENFIDPENLKIVREGMREAVTYGSSVLLNDLPVKVASKTGTAETGRTGFYHNWVTVFAPYEDPQIVLTIVIENVKGAQVVALPVAKEILSWYFGRHSK